MNLVGVPELADRLALEAAGWSLVVVRNESLAAVVPQLKEELASILEDEKSGAIHALSTEDPQSAVDTVAAMPAGDIVLMPVPSAEVLSTAHVLEYSRGTLVGAARGVILVVEADVELLAGAAPNFWSWIGPRLWLLDTTVGTLDTTKRLESLRAGTGLTNEDVVERAKAGTLPSDPVFAEWLALLGRGDLIGS